MSSRPYLHPHHSWMYLGQTAASCAVLMSVSGGLSHFIILTEKELGRMGRRSALQGKPTVKKSVSQTCFRQVVMAIAKFDKSRFVRRLFDFNDKKVYLVAGAVSWTRK